MAADTHTRICAGLLLCSAAVFASINPTSVPSNQAAIFTFQSYLNFSNATNATILFVKDGSVTSSQLHLEPTFQENSGNKIVAAFDAINGNTGVASIAFSGTDTSGAAVSTAFEPVLVYTPPSALTLSQATCPVAICELSVTVAPAYVNRDTLVRLTDKNGVHSLWPGTVTGPGTVDVVLRSLQEGNYTVSIAVNGVHFSPSTAVLTAQDPGVLKVGFAFIGTIEDEGWTYAHNVARLALEKQYAGQVQTKFVDWVDEYDEDNQNVKFKELVDLGCTLIVGNSFGFMNTMVELSNKPEYSHIKWVHIAGYKTTPTLSTGFARMYQTRYLAGIIAGGQMAKEANPTCIAYPAAYTIPEVVRQINAFTLGCKLVYANCTVKTLFIETWHDNWIEENAAKYAWDTLGCRYFHHHSDNLIPQEIYRDRGGKGLGFNVDARAKLGDSILVSALYNWQWVYTYFIEEVLQDRWAAHTQFWPGMTKGAISLTSISPLVHSSVRNLANSEHERLAKGDGDVFCGVLYKDDGSVVPGSSAGTCLSDGDMLGMDWLIQGVSNDGTYIAPPKPVPEEPWEMDTAELAAIGIGVAVAWVWLTTPIMYGLFTYGDPLATQLIPEVACESALDAVELSAAVLVFSQLKDGMSTVAKIQAALISIAVVNILTLDMYSLYVCFNGRVQASLERLNYLTNFRHKHSMVTIALVLPMAVLEIIVYLDSASITDLACVIILCFDLGYRISQTRPHTTFPTSTEDLSQVTKTRDAGELEPDQVNKATGPALEPTSMAIDVPVARGCC